jgi:hypothetical protein
VVAGFSERTPYPNGKAKRGVRSEKSVGVAIQASLERFPFEGSGLQVLASASKLLAVHPNFIERSDNLTYSSA